RPDTARRRKSLPPAARPPGRFGLPSGGAPSPRVGRRCEDASHLATRARGQGPIAFFSTFDVGGRDSLETKVRAAAGLRRDGGNARLREAQLVELPFEQRRKGTLVRCRRTAAATVIASRASRAFVAAAAACARCAQRTPRIASASPRRRPWRRP